MSKFKRILLICSILLVTISCDQVTKNAAHKVLSSSEPVSISGNLILLQYVENRGAFLSLGEDWPDTLRVILLTILPALFLLFTLIILIISDKTDRFTIAAFALILGGGISNMWDRVFNNGFVVDFINMGIGNLRTGIFNAADVFLMVGCGLVLYKVIRQWNFQSAKN